MCIYIYIYIHIYIYIYNYMGPPTTKKGALIFAVYSPSTQDWTMDSVVQALQRQCFQ